MTQPNSNEISEPILTVLCNEPEGLVERKIYPLILTEENLAKYWNKAKGYKTLFHHRITGFKDFLSVFLAEYGNHLELKGMMWVVDDFVGVYYITDFIPREDANVHFTFFDRRIRGRDVLTSRMLDYVFTEFKFRRLSAEIPSYASEATHKFVQHLGFRQEGVKRSATMLGNKVYDVKLYGILYEEAKARGAILNGRKDKEHD